MRVFCTGRLMTIAAMSVCVSAADLTPQQIEFFEKRVRPVLVKNCYPCHSSASKSPMGGLRVDTRESLLRGGDKGPVVEPGDAGHSCLIQAVSYSGDLKTPPSGRLPDEQSADLQAWIQMVAPDLRIEPAAA